MALALAFGATHYRWREDVQALVTRFERRYRTKANTYVDHPTGMGLDDVSVDFWSPRGRGEPIHPSTGSAIFRNLKNVDRRLRWRWLIWQGRIYWPGGTDRPYSDASDLHFDHVHVTFW